MNDEDIAENADFDIPFAASANPDNPVIEVGVAAFSESIDGSPGILGTPDNEGSPGILGTLGSPGILATLGSEGIIPLREVTIELAPPVVVAKLDAKFPELIALATLAIAGSVAIIRYSL